MNAKRKTAPPKSKRTAKPSGLEQLVGKFFHTFTDKGQVIWQGRITGVLPEQGVLIVTRLDWFMGFPSDEILVRVEDLISPVNGRVRFALYDDAGDMKIAYDNFSPWKRGEIIDDDDDSDMKFQSVAELLADPTISDPELEEGR
jgi:hypothetical protein